MRNLRLTGAGVVLVIATIMCGCSEDSNPGESPKNPPEQTAKSDLELRTILNKQAPSDKHTPIQSVLSQIEWEFSNSAKLSPSEEHVSWTAKFLHNSVVILKVPVTDRWYNFVFLTQKGEEWTMVGLADMRVKKEDMFPNKEGLDLPMDSFVPSKLSIGAEDNQAWTFADEKKQVIIGKYPHSNPFSVIENAQVVQINGIEAWYIKEDTESSLLYYLDQGQVVWITGNLSESEMLSLANSLPSSSLYTFPFAKPQSS